MTKNVLFVFAMIFAITKSPAQEAAIAPFYLWSAAEAEVPKVNCDPNVSWDIEDGKIKLTFSPGNGSWPGLSIMPKSGTWDLSSWGHVEVVLGNRGDKPLSVGLRVDNEGDWRNSPWNSESIYLRPGETKIGKVIFGYQHGFKKGFKLDSSKIAAVKIFLNGKSAEKRTLIVGEVVAAGAAGEKPPVDPSRIVVKPKGGVILETPFQVKVGQKSLPAVLKPKSGYWNLGDYLKVTAAVKNTGKKTITPKLTVDSSGGKISAAAGKMIKPGASGRVEVCFIPEKPWFAQGEGKDVKPIGGTKFESHRVRSLLFGAVEPQGEYEVMSVKCEKVTAKIPSWLGRRPPVPGKWKQTLSEEFNNSSLNEKIWSPYSSNYWDKRTHFTRDNIIFRDGCCVLRYEKKRGAKNDDPALGETDYACGILDSFGKWTQLYGYFEARMKLPTKPGLWPAFWTMPDRGASAGSERWMRADTKKGGMEFDIMEYLTIWGPYRFNVACHWDGYGKYHRSLGTTCVYMPTDEDGFITVGMLWLPGVWAIYGNGIELARWESARVSNVPAHIFFYMVSGGWANEPLNDDELPDEFQIDWFRVWQREDLVD